MPQVVDLEALVCGGGGDGKIVCETMLHDPAECPLPPAPLEEPDQPAESFRLRVGEEIDWVDRNAAPFYDRDDSTKEITNPKSQQHQHQHGNPTPNVKLQSSSQRYAAKPKAPIIGLPNKLQHSGYLGQSARRHAANVRIFPKKACGAPRRGKSAVPESEPTSPKVSCIGRVLSDRDRNRRRKAYHKGPSDVSGEASSIAASSDVRRQRSGFWASIFGFSCFGQGRKSSLIDEEGLPSSRTTTSTTKNKTTPSPTASAVSRADAVGDTAPPAPGLGGMKRFASGRRPASWGGELEQDAELVSKSGPLPGKQQGAGILGRRWAGTLEGLDCDREWESSGPASV